MRPHRVDSRPSARRQRRRGANRVVDLGSTCGAK